MDAPFGFLLFTQSPVQHVPVCMLMRFSFSTRINYFRRGRDVFVAIVGLSVCLCATDFNGIFKEDKFSTQID